MGWKRKVALGAVAVLAVAAAGFFALAPGIVEKGQNATPVSYTHLDVYKRQAGGYALFKKGRCGGQGQRRLGDVMLGVGLDPLAEFLDLGLGGFRADQHPVTARAMDLFHHQIAKIRPVSYTHLDVYKRQDQGRAPDVGLASAIRVFVLKSFTG